MLQYLGWLKPVLGFCLPRYCVVCEKADEAAVPLCGTCQSRFDKLLQRHRCPWCAKPIEVGAACAFCRDRGLAPYRRIASLGVYEEPMRTVIHKLKYQRRWTLADFFATHLRERPEVAEILDQANCIVPVPLHWRRAWSRGYNQADLLARRLHKTRAWPASRVANTPTQTRLSATQRHENMQHAFALRRPGLIAGKHVVVIDDVLTTGATLQALGRVLAKARPLSLNALVLGVADPLHRDFEVV